MGRGKATKASATSIGVTVEIKNGRVQNKTQNLYHLTPYFSLICVKSRAVAVLAHQICPHNMKCQLRPSTRDFKKMTAKDIYCVLAFLSFHFSKINNSFISNSLFVAVQQKGKCLLRPILASSPLLTFSTTKQSFESCGLQKKKKTFRPAAFRHKFSCENSYPLSYNYPIHHELSYCQLLSLIGSLLTPDKNSKRPNKQQYREIGSKGHVKNGQPY